MFWCDVGGAGWLCGGFGVVWCGVLGGGVGGTGAGVVV